MQNVLTFAVQLCCSDRGSVEMTGLPVTMLFIYASGCQCFGGTSCKHLQVCLHTAIPSDTHITSFLLQARDLFCNTLNHSYRTKNRQFSVDLMCDLRKIDTYVRTVVNYTY
jgi:hypothetical protein